MSELKQQIERVSKMVDDLKMQHDPQTLQRALTNTIALLREINTRLDTIDTKMATASVSGDTVVWGS